MISGGFSDGNLLFYLQNYGVVLVTAIVVSLPVFPALKTKLESAPERTRSVVSGVYATALVVLFGVAISYMVADTYNPFLYFRF